MAWRRIERLSPNREPRRQGRRPDMLIMHYTAMQSAEKAVDWLCNPVSKVSCHYLVDEDGTIVAMVPEAERPGMPVSHWAGETDLNSCSIGIEIHNVGPERGYPDFPEPQLRAVEELSLGIIARNAIPPERVLAHSDIAPFRKIDPGEKFPWQRMARAGIGRFVPEAPPTPGETLQRGAAGPEVGRLQRMLAIYGYGIGADARL
ncbi:MAG: N-acetylmuramoyl-L-alanine amidase [Hyphomicrobiaceae bacterium]